MRLFGLFEKFFAEVSGEIDKLKMLIRPVEIEFFFAYVLDYFGVKEDQKW